MPRIFEAREREPTTIPIDDILRDGILDIIPEVQRREYFDITFRGDRLTVTAGKYVGLIPLNERVFIRVEPKVPVGSLLLMLSAVEGEVIELAILNRCYRTTPGTPTPHLLTAIASAFASKASKRCALPPCQLRGCFSPASSRVAVGRSFSAR